MGEIPPQNTRIELGLYVRLTSYFYGDLPQVGESHGAWEPFNDLSNSLLPPLRRTALNAQLRDDSNEPSLIAGRVRHAERHVEAHD